MLVVWSPGRAEAPLFASDETLELGMELDFGDLCLNPEAGDCAKARAVILYRDDDGSQRRLDVRLKTRGRWRKDTGNCAFPALFIDFDGTDTADTPFAGQDVLPFTSHCQHFRKEYHAYTLLEFLAYRYYNLLTDDSVRVRLARIAYRDTGSRRRYVRYGFFSEHFGHMGERIGAEWFEPDELDPRATDAMALARLSLFQYMIGNLDWSVVIPHNVALFRRASGEVVAAPFDFDYAGLVDAEYAAPPKFMNLRSVRIRRYRGFCRPEIEWDRLFAGFEAIRPAVLGLLSEQEGLERGSRRRGRYFLNQFYDTLDSPRKREERIIDACRPMPEPE